jgi:hypothetical protein
MAYSAGDMYQHIQDTITEYMFDGQQMGWKYTCHVTAENGNAKTYVLYFTYAKILSTNTQLANIYIGGESLIGFTPDQFNYLVELQEDALTPSILVEKAEYLQQVQITHGDTTRINVIAEDTTYQSTYMIIFQRQQSSYSYLKAIYMNEELLSGFRVDSFEYDIELPFGTTELPSFTYDLGHDKQTIQIDTLLATTSNGMSQTTLRFSVTAADPVFSSEYDIRITIAFNDNSRLRTLLIHGKTIENFHADTVNYVYTYPIGTDSTSLALATDIEAIAEDTNAIVSVTESETDILIQVTAQDGKNVRIYTIHQVILQSSDASLQMILLDSIPLHGFTSDVLEYTYYVTTNQPSIQTITTDSTATVEYGIYALGEPFHIYVTAADGTENVYTILFLESSINVSQSPTTTDVLFKYVGGTMDIVFATIRKNVSVAVYDAQGHQVFHAPVPAATQNEATLITNATGVEELVDVHSTFVTCTIPTLNQCYFYVFFENNKRRIASGKFTLTH